MSLSTITLQHITLPERLQNALEQWQRLGEHQLYFAPVRHHSPACAYSVLSLIEQVKPDYVLIEGPDSFNPLIAGLLDGDTRPPVAIMGQTTLKSAPTESDESDAVTRSAYFPFCEYSPEWQALRIKLNCVLLICRGQHRWNLIWKAKASIKACNGNATLPIAYLLLS